MLNPSNRAARVYAEAMIAIGREQDLLTQIYNDLMALEKIYDEDRIFRAFFTSPRLDSERKFEILTKALEGQVCKPVLGLLKVMIQKGRELLLDNVADQFVRFKDLAEGKVHVQVATARALDDDQKEEIREKVEKISGKIAILHEKLQPDLIGGTVVRVGDLVVDGSIKRKLKALRKSMVAKERIFD